MAQQDVSRLRQELREAVREASELKERCSRLEAESQSAESAADRTDTEKAQLASRVASLQASLDATTSELATLRQRHIELSAKADTTATMLAVAQGGESSQTKQCEALQARLQAVRRCMGSGACVCFSVSARTHARNWNDRPRRRRRWPLPRHAPMTCRAN